MEAKIIEIITACAPIVAGFITSVLIPFLIKKWSLKSLQRKINTVNSGAQLEAMKKELAAVHKEILEMRGKIK